MLSRSWVHFCVSHTDRTKYITYILNVLTLYKALKTHNHPFSGASQTNMHRQHKYKSFCQTVELQGFKTILSHCSNSRKWLTCFACIIIIAACFCLSTVRSTQAISTDGCQIQISPQQHAGCAQESRVAASSRSFYSFDFTPVWQAAFSHTTSLSDFRLILSFCFSIAFSSSVTFFTSCDKPGTGKFCMMRKIHSSVQLPSVKNLKPLEQN